MNFLTESYARLCKNKHFTFFVLCVRRPHVPRTRYRYQVFMARSTSQLVPRSYCCTKRVTPLESSHDHHLPTRAASARAARGPCFDPKRAATAPGCRVRSASPEHRVGSLLMGQDQTQAHSRSSTRGSSTTPDDGSHIHRIVPPRCRTESSLLRAGRVWACTRPLQSVHAAAELVCRRRVVLLVSYVMSTAVVGRVALDYCCIIVRLHMNPTTCQVIT